MTRVCSIFSQILQLIPRLEFESAVRQHHAERHARGFTSWGQFIAMLFCQLGHAKSLREICGGLAASEGKLRHLGLPTAPSRSTLAYANEHRPWQLHRTVFEQRKRRTMAVWTRGWRVGMMPLVGTEVSVHEEISGHFEAVTKRSEVATALDDRREA